MNLPINEVLPELLQLLQHNSTVLLTAAPGAGKTTMVPLALLNESWLQNSRIIMLEPRRIAARHAAHFMAQIINENIGETVGYRIRLENKVSARTRIEVVTEGILTRMLQNDPELNGVGLIIFDEFHERHLASDLALALIRQCQQLLRPDLRILIMSATLDSNTLSQALDAPSVISAGHHYPINIHYRAMNNATQSLSEHCAKIIQEALHHEGDILVFLPGIKEIKQVQRNLPDLPNVLALPLHGQLNDKEQKAAIAPTPNGERKIILATNIAESSLTIDGVRIVIDSGLEKRNEFHVANGIGELKTRHISQASATQRAGRAARQSPGTCFRLWSEDVHHRLDAHIRAEILDADLTPLMFELLIWGADIKDLHWQNLPPAPAVLQARQLLQQLNLSQDGKSLSEHGAICAKLGIEPRWAHALVISQQLNIGKTACNIIALIQEWPVTKRDTDDLVRLYQHAQKHPLWQERIDVFAQRLWNILKENPVLHKESISTEDAIALIIALAFPDRIAKRRDNNDSFLLSNGRGVALLQQSDLLNDNWLASCDINIGQSARIQLAASLSSTSLNYLRTYAPQMFNERTQVGWQSNGQFIARKSLMLGSLVVESTSLPKLTNDEWLDAWHTYITEQGLKCLTWNDSALQIRARLQLAHEHLATFPAVDDESLLAILGQWLLPFMGQARHLRDLDSINVATALISLLDFDQQQQLNTLLPTHLTVPSGSSIAIDYSQKPPVLAVKLQEMFGYEGQPMVLNNKIPLIIHLLSPAKHPLQVTADLPHFWRNTYSDVRKDMRGRYPKHPWPDDPLSAEATRLTKAALARKQEK